MSDKTDPHKRVSPPPENDHKKKKHASPSAPEPDQSTSMEKLNIITWNINGKSSDRVAKTLKELVSKSDGIQIIPHAVFLQETHCEGFQENITKGWHVFNTCYNNSDKGVAILVNKSKCPNFTHVQSEVDSNGRYVVVRCRLVSSQEYTLVSVYNHQKDTKSLDLLTPYLQNSSGTLLIGGDFNTTLGKKDRARQIITEEPTGYSRSSVPEYKSHLELYGPNEINSQHEKIRKCVERFIRSLQLVDVFRGKNGYDRCDETCFTYRQEREEDGKSNLSRLDYFFIPEECMLSVTRCEVLQCLAIKTEGPVTRSEVLQCSAIKTEGPVTRSKGQAKPSEFLNDHAPLLLQLDYEQTELENFKKLQVTENPGTPQEQHQNSLQNSTPLEQHQNSLQNSTPLEQHQNSLQNINGVEIVAVIQSLPLKHITGTQYKRSDISPKQIENLKQDLRNLIVSILGDKFNSASEITSTVKQYHSFSMKYLVLSTILAWRLQDWGNEVELDVGVDKDRRVTATGDKVEWRALQGLIQEKLKDHPHENDFSIIEKMLSSGTPGTIRLYNGCPLSRTLRKLFLK